MSDNRLDQDFRIPALLKFTAPTAVMMVFMALYQMVDGAFVAQFVGERLSTLEDVTGTATHFILHKYKEKHLIFEKQEKQPKEWIFS